MNELSKSDVAALLELVKWKRGLRGPGLRNDPGAASFLAQPKNRGAYGAGPPIFAQLISAQPTPAPAGYYTAALVSLAATGGNPMGMVYLSQSIAVVNIPEALANTPSRTLLNGQYYPIGSGPLFRCWPLGTINKFAGFTKVMPLYAIEAHDSPVVSFQLASGPLPLTAPVATSNSGPFDTIAFVANVQIKYSTAPSPSSSDEDLSTGQAGAAFNVSATYNGTQVAQGQCAALSGGAISETYITNVSLSGQMLVTGQPPFNLDISASFTANGGPTPSWSATGWVTFVLVHTAQF